MSIEVAQAIRRTAFSSPTLTVFDIILSKYSKIETQR